MVEFDRSGDVSDYWRIMISTATTTIIIIMVASDYR